MTSQTSDLADLADLFATAGVPPAYAARAAARLGPGAAGALRADPWRLLGVAGVRPEQADHFARRVLGEQATPADPRRGRALVVHVLTEAARQGHTALPAKAVLAALGGLRVADPERAVNDALDEAEVMALVEEPAFDESAEDLDDLPEPEESLGLARYAMAEEDAAEGFQRLTATATPLLPDEILKPLRADLPELRALALTAAVRTGVSVLHGTPADVEEVALLLAEAAAEHDRRAVLATDLYRLLEGRGEQRPVEADLVIVPDAGALDVEMAGALVEACADGTHLVLGADPAGLPSAGPGRVMADLTESETVPVIDLDPGTAGPLEVFGAALRRGELAAVDAPGREVVIVPAADAGECVHRAVQLVTDSIPRALGIPVADVQVVTPQLGGDAGGAALNAALKARLNPGPGRYRGFDPGDRVIAVAALPGAAPGTAGTVTGATAEGLEVAFGPDPAGPVSLVPIDQVPRLRHGWAATVALARGRRRPAVVAVLPAEAGDLLSRRLMVTACGLAGRHLSVVHDAGPALARTVREDAGTVRNTRLATLLRQ